MIKSDLYYSKYGFIFIHKLVNNEFIITALWSSIPAVYIEDTYPYKLFFDNEFKLVDDSTQRRFFMQQLFSRIAK